jgi:dipeptidyl aminopeptidase/acylaminoacyl peptidase
MAEPSIAGMRVEGEKLSPDGTKVVFLWNAEGKMPRDLYLVSTSGGTPASILKSSDLPAPTRTPQPENKLNYGLELRDDFVKARENQLGGFEWSPDSKKLVFSYGGDVYLLDLERKVSVLDSDREAVSDPSSPERHWKQLESAYERRVDLISNLVKTVKMAGIQESEFFAKIADARSKLLNAIRGKTAMANPKTEEEKHVVTAANDSLSREIERLISLSENYPILRSNESYNKVLDELTGVENRINVYRRDYLDSLPPAKLKRLTKTQSPEVGARFLDNERILFSQSGNAYVLNTSDPILIQVTKEANTATFISVGNITPNKAGTLVAYVVSDSSKQRALVVPNYLPEFVAANPTRRGWSEQKLFATPTDGSHEIPFEIKLPKQEGVSFFRRMVWTADGQSLIVDRVDKDTKRRQLFYVHNVGSKAEQIILVTEETDDKWQASLSVIFEPNPKDSAELFFGSERDGFNHLYLAKLEPRKPEPNPTGEIRAESSDPGFSSNVTVTQLTKGNWQVEWAKWDPKVSQIIYLSTEKGAAERTFSIIGVDGKKVAPFADTANSKPIGMIESPQIATDSASSIPQIIYGVSKWNQPTELIGEKICFSCTSTESFANPVYLTRSTPESFKQIKWNGPKFLEIASRDGKKIPAKIYLPSGHSAKQKYPMVIFVHGAGYLQNTINGWNNYYREFMFNEMLTQKGYVVLDIDYRGSAGYGRDWRTDVYDFLGGKDYDDHIDSIDFMVKNYGVNQSKIGVYGGSYGGFMAAMLATRAPDKIAAAAALRPVMDWKNYYATNPGYTAQRLGFPDKNPEGYKRSSPITYADKLERPLLILHGMSDDNVHVQDSVQMIEKLIRLGKTKYFEAMLYPSENHGFVRPESWTDEYERIFAFFEKNLK